MEDVFTEYRDSQNVEAIVMIGVVSECILVQETVRQKFLYKNIIVPKHAYLAMVKGAVLSVRQSCQ